LYKNFYKDKTTIKEAFMVVLFFLLAFFILGLFFSKLKIVVKKLDFEMIEKVNSKKDYEVKIGIYLYGKIKIFGIVIEEDGVKIFGQKISYRRIKKSKFYENMMKEDIAQIDKSIIKDNIKTLNMKFEKVNLNLKLGTDSTLITSFLTFAVSTAVSFIIQKSVTKYNPKKHKFIITPLYENRMNINVFLELIASFNVKDIIKVLYHLNNLSKVEHNKHKVKFKEIKI